MDSSFTIKPPPAARSPRDPVPVREAAATDLVSSKTVTTRDGNAGKHGRDNPPDDGGHKDREPRGDHGPHDLVADPASREVIWRERDVRSSDRDHIDQALLRYRAYHRQIHHAEPEPQTPGDPHADIKA